MKIIGHEKYWTCDGYVMVYETNVGWEIRKEYPGGYTMAIPVSPYSAPLSVIEMWDLVVWYHRWLFIKRAVITFTIALPLAWIFWGVLFQ